MARAFAACGALQCGFCTPGIAVRAKALIDRKGSALTREEASRHLGGHLCRCTGYIKILDAVEALASGNIPEPIKPGGIGSCGVKYEGLELAVGLASLHRRHADLRVCCTAPSNLPITPAPTSSLSTPAKPKQLRELSAY